ncbi:MAG TPA: hypothetical protein VIK14_15855 [Ignavibacteria bacterium]
MFNFELAEKIYSDFQSSSEKELVKDLIEYSVRYSQIRVEWQLANIEQRKELEDTRIRAHDAFIDSCNILSRAMEKAGEDNSWREKLGNDRKELGDFACYINYRLGLLSR